MCCAAISAADLVGQQPDVLGGLDQVDHREVDGDEVGEVAEPEEVGQLLRVGRHRARVTFGELGDDRGDADPTWCTCSSALGRPAMKAAGVGQRGQGGVGRHGPQSGNARREFCAAIHLRCGSCSSSCEEGDGRGEAGRRGLRGPAAAGPAARAPPARCPARRSGRPRQRLRGSPSISPAATSSSPRRRCRSCPARLEAGAVQRVERDGETLMLVDAPVLVDGLGARVPAPALHQGDPGVRSTSVGQVGRDGGAPPRAGQGSGPAVRRSWPARSWSPRAEAAGTDQGPNQPQPRDVALVVLGLGRRRPLALVQQPLAQVVLDRRHRDAAARASSEIRTVSLLRSIPLDIGH